MATRYTFTDDSADVRLSGFLTPEPVGASGGTFTGPVAIVPTTYAPVGAAFQVIAKDDPPSGSTVVQVQDALGGDIFAVDDDGAITSYLASNRSVRVRAQGGDVLFDFRNVGGAGRAGFFGAAAVAQPSITGSLSTVVDPAAKAVLTSLLAALVSLGLATDGTT